MHSSRQDSEKSQLKGVKDIHLIQHQPESNVGITCQGF